MDEYTQRIIIAVSAFSSFFTCALFLVLIETRNLTEYLVDKSKGKKIKTEM